MGATSGPTGKPDCDELLTHVADLLHGELDAERTAHLKRHLEDCPPCFETADFQAHLRQLVAKRCCEQVPDDFRARLLAMLQTGGTAQDSVGPTGPS